MFAFTFVNTIRGSTRGLILEKEIHVFLTFDGKHELAFRSNAGWVCQGGRRKIGSQDKCYCHLSYFCFDSLFEIGWRNEK